MLKKMQDKITNDRATAKADRESALALKQEYEEKLKAIDKEAESILSEARKVAKHNETKIVEEAKAEAARIIERANTEAELEKQKCAHEEKQQINPLTQQNPAKEVAKTNTQTS